MYPRKTKAAKLDWSWLEKTDMIKWDENEMKYRDKQLWNKVSNIVIKLIGIVEMYWAGWYRIHREKIVDWNKQYENIYLDYEVKQEEIN